jgi:uncharacterized protein
MHEFDPHPLLRNPDVMTIAAALWLRRFPDLNRAEDRLFEVEPGTRILARCHWQAEPRRHPALVLVHGLEGSSESNYILGTAEKAFRRGFSVVRMNQRNCGGSERLSPTLYNSGLSGDVRAVVVELIARDKLPEVFAAGFSMGGNLVLKMTGEFGATAPPEFRGAAAVCPSIELAACADAIGKSRNFVYEWHFVRSLKRRMRLKASLFPNRYPLDGLEGVRSVREFDDVITARFCGFRNADDYYARSSASRVMAAIRVPTLVLTAQDDPMVPYTPFLDPVLQSNPCLTLLAPRHGGHCAFVSREDGDERFWAEARVVEFCANQSRQLADSS